MYISWAYITVSSLWARRRLKLQASWLFAQSKRTLKLCVTGLCVENPPGTDGFPSQRASDAVNVSIWWRHRSCYRLFNEATLRNHHVNPFRTDDINLTKQNTTQQNRLHMGWEILYEPDKTKQSANRAHNFGMYATGWQALPHVTPGVPFINID